MTAAPLSRRQFCFGFVLLAVCFVPIVINLGLVGLIVPTCYGIAVTLKELVRLHGRLALAFGLYSAVYIVVFYLLARLLHLVIGCFQHDRAVKALQILVLAALFGCSFLRVLTYGSIQGRGGTYMFWTAVERYFERALPRPVKRSGGYRPSVARPTTPRPSRTDCRRSP